MTALSCSVPAALPIINGDSGQSSGFPKWSLRKQADVLRAFFRYSAGLSNLRLGHKWEDPSWAAAVRGCTRACPLGMMLPLILGVTTRDGEFTMTMTSARGGYSTEQLDEIARSLGEFLDALPAG